MLRRGQTDPDKLAAGDFRRCLPRFQAPDRAANRARIAGFAQWCAAHSWAMPAVALAWILDQGPRLTPFPARGVRSIWPIGRAQRRLC